MKKNVLWAAVVTVYCLLIVVSALAINAYAADTGFVLHPSGRIRVALRSVGGGSATWYPVEPRVYDGSFSARLYTGTTPNQDGGAVLIGPLGWPLSMFTDDRITFWTYHYNDGASPYVNIVLDNGRIMEGIGSQPVSTGATVKIESVQGYPSADIWIQMRPAGGGDSHHVWATSYGSVDSVLSPVASCTSSSPCTMAFWQHAFPNAKVIQIQIIYGIWGSTGQIIYIDDASILGVVVPIEPETISA